jgi:ADP-dependent NAD(P)H-hydrate dehydratase / NAD(P)H-hydrate epimerase
VKILTAAEMREVDSTTIERGIPGIILMENAGNRVVEYLREALAPLSQHRTVIFCGKGNNGGDGFVVARQLWQQRLYKELTVIEAFPQDQLTGDAATARKMLSACGCGVLSEIPERALQATLVIDALLGTGMRGAASGRGLELIQAANNRFPHAVKVAVDLPSGFPTDDANPPGEYVRVHHTVTFTALKRSQAFSPSYEAMGKLQVCPIGTPEDLCENNSKYKLRLATKIDFADLFAPRPKDSNKGMYGHVLIVGGSAAKPGAPSMAGLAALRTGAGLATVASSSSAIGSISGYSPALMTEPLTETATGSVANEALAVINALLKGKTVAALGPGLGTEKPTVDLVRELYKTADVPLVVDADGLNALVGSDFKTDKIRILTPHPGEMGRLTGTSAKDVQANRLDVAERLARDTGATVVLKGDRTLIAFRDGCTWVNPTGCPAMATGGTGDVLTGMVAGLVAQHPQDWKRAVVAAVWLHGRAGEIGGARLGEESFIATDLLRFLPAAIRECRASA